MTLDAKYLEGNRAKRFIFNFPWTRDTGFLQEA